jgi:hypothetical protein
MVTINGHFIIPALFLWSRVSRSSPPSANYLYPSPPFAANHTPTHVPVLNRGLRTLLWGYRNLLGIHFSEIVWIIRNILIKKSPEFREQTEEIYWWHADNDQLLTKVKKQIAKFDSDRYEATIISWKYWMRIRDHWQNQRGLFHIWISCGTTPNSGKFFKQVFADRTNRKYAQRSLDWWHNCTSVFHLVWQEEKWEVCDCESDEGRDVW